MNHEDEIDDEIDDAPEYENPGQMPGDGDVEDLIRFACTGPDPLDFSDPESAYLLLRDDAQDDIEGTGTRKMACRRCGHVFRGEAYDYCPECFALDVREIG